ncbi:MAG: histidinol-phosphate transaminase [Candidatus Margulisbacteria bacterium]|nr:histidinol-phosphate transaminase [Candidatus Margulisiibacteriota bacterium]
MLKPRKELKELIPYIAGKFKEGCIKLASNENPLGPSPKAQQSIIKGSVAMQLYPDGNCTKLKQKLAVYYGLKPENFIIGNGSDEILLFIAGAFLTAKDKVLISKTTFSEYEFSARLFGAKPIFIPLKNNKYDLEGFRKALSKKPKVVYLCNPNNPTGTIFKENELKVFLKAVPKSCLVVIDEAYNEYVQDRQYPDSVKLAETYSNIIILRTFSKIFGLAGLRIGYGIASKDLINVLNKTREPFNVNRLAQQAALAALDDETFLIKSIDNNLEGKKYLYQQFAKLGLPFTKTEANFIYVDLPLPAKDIFQRMLNESIIIRPLDSFSKPFAMRVTIGTPWQNKRLVDALKKSLRR